MIKTAMTLHAPISLPGYISPIHGLSFHHSGTEDKRMALMTWNPDYSVKIREIDEQHKQLIAMINELNEAMSSGRGKETLGSILDRLTRYVASHFQLEEKLMEQHGYPEFADHKDKHQKMTAKVLSLREDYKQGKIALTIEVAKFLQDWLNKHILSTDQKYAPFLTAKGVR